jgi:DNA ligase-associated metallophosphoesterase
VTTSPVVELAGQRLRLLPDRAALWEDRGWLLVADLHLGKDALFRRRGLPVPEGTTAHDLARLDALAAALAPDAIIFLGDFLHGPESAEADCVEQFARWRAGRGGLRMVLVPGNHDARARTSAARLGLEEVPAPWAVAGLHLCHHPGGPVPWVAGHVHPVMRLRAGGAGRLRAPAYVLGGGGLLLPAFGRFTGGAEQRPGPGDRVFLCGPGAVVELPQNATGR